MFNNIIWEIELMLSFWLIVSILYRNLDKYVNM